MNLIITKKTRAKRPKDPQTNDLIFSIPSVNLSFYCILKKYKDITAPVCQFNEPQFEEKLGCFTMLKKFKKNAPNQSFNDFAKIFKYLKKQGLCFLLAEEKKPLHYSSEQRK